MWAVADLHRNKNMTDIDRLATAFFGSADHRPPPFSAAASALPAWMQTNAPAPHALPAAEVLAAAHYFDWLLEVPPIPAAGTPGPAQPEWLPLSTVAVQAAALQPTAQTQELPAWLLEDTPVIPAATSQRCWCRMLKHPQYKPHQPTLPKPPLQPRQQTPSSWHTRTRCCKPAI